MSSGFSGLTPLAVADPDLYEIIQLEHARQASGLELIASENFTSRAVLECLGSVLTNKYAEGEVGARYYGGAEYVDLVEALAKKRALAAFNLDPEVWAVNVQPYSGSPANFEVYTALLKPHERMLGLDLPSGGHLTHGYCTAKKKISATSIFWESMHYHVNDQGLINYEEMETMAQNFRPQIIVLGASAYPRDYDYERVRSICDNNNNAIFMMDMAHTAGLIAGKVLKNPFEYADVVTTTTHKSLRGPRAAMIFFRKVGRDGKPTDYENRINMAVFPGLQGGPHMNAIGGIATQMREVATPEFAQYAKQVVLNAQALAGKLMEMGHDLSSNGTDNHIVLWNLRKHDVTGSKLEKVLEYVQISTNKNTVPGDKNPLNPMGVRLGTPALTTRDMKEAEMLVVAGFLDRACKIAVQIQAAHGKALKDFVAALPANEDLKVLRKEVQEFALKFPFPGADLNDCKYKNGVPHH